MTEDNKNYYVFCEGCLTEQITKNKDKCLNCNSKNTLVWAKDKLKNPKYDKKRVNKKPKIIKKVLLKDLI
ncbi:MAG: hypothetical protein ACOCP8_07645 [archaeon]